MKIVNCLNDLNEYGIKILTGEACNLGARLLCDLTYEGVQLVSKAFGMVCPAKTNGGELIGGSFTMGWNSGIASIMLGYNDYHTLGIFALLDHIGVSEVWRIAYEGGTIGYIGLEGEKLVNNGEYKIAYRDGEDNHLHYESWVAKWEYMPAKVNDAGDVNLLPWPSCYGLPQQRYAYSNLSGPRVDDRNVHQMSKRVS